jgi:N-acetyl-gamma-glutamyl-phosphate reductase
VIRAAVFGATGFTGLELIKILSGHKGAALKYLVSGGSAGKKVSEVFPHLYGLGDTVFAEPDAEKIADGCDVVFTALPHTKSAELCGAFVRRGVKVIDLSADFRYRDVSVYEATYGVTHPARELSASAVYGLPELYRKEIAKAAIVANPGCYTTCSILPLYPLLAEGLIDPASVIIDAKSGASGAGRSADTFCEINENFKAYAVAAHRHTSEIEQELSVAAGKKINVCFTPHLLPVQRGIFATMYAVPLKGAGSAEIASAYEKFYGGEYFIRVYPYGAFPELKHVRGTNFLAIGYKFDERNNRLILGAALDNLVKGASGQAVQNMNILFGLPETEGLAEVSRYI